MENKMTFGRLLRMERKRQVLTQKKLGERMGIGAQTISSYESGRRMPKIETMERFAAALDVPVSCLYPIKSGDPTINFAHWKPCKICDLSRCDTCRHVLNDSTEYPCDHCEMSEHYKPYNFCPNCGRPLTPAARELLERRLRG